MLDDLKLNSTAVYYCKDGFILVGESTRVCTDDLTWSGETPICLGIHFSVIIVIHNTFFYFTSIHSG